LLTNYGFSEIFVYWSEVPNYVAAGWNYHQIIARLEGNINTPNASAFTHAMRTDAINLLNNTAIKGFYIDEPLERDNTNQGLAKVFVLETATLVKPKTLIVSSWDNGYTSDYNSIINATINVNIMCDEYKSPYIPYITPSIISRWTSFKNKWSYRNHGNFVEINYQYQSANNHYTKWDELFPHARTLGGSGLDVVCLYSDDPPTLQSAKLHNFCGHAFNNYYLRGYAQHVSIVERCDLPNCVGCNDPENWYIDYIIYHNDWFEVFP